ncbi:MAG: hypothetical protein ABL958_11980 [Bdellovibrionia bacterium]
MIRALLALITMFAAHPAFAREATFSWEPFENVYAYEIRISKEPEFVEQLLRKGVKKPTFTVDLPIGKYYYKVRAVDQSKRYGQWSEAVPFTIPPYPPELKAPKNGTVYTYYEIPPPVTMEWNPIEGEIEYEVLVTKTTGQKALEKRTRDPRLMTGELTEGEYSWRVRSIYQELYESPYSEPRYFGVERKEFKAPILIDPIGKKAIPAYRAVDFTWKRDEAMKFSDVNIQIREPNTGQTWGDKNILEKEAFHIPYMEPGEYVWAATNKEDETTHGLTSEQESFEVRNDFVSAGNTSVTVGIAPSSYVVRGGGDEFARTSIAYNLGIKYYPWEAIGLALDFQSNPLARAPYDIPYQRSGASLLIRGGVPGFAQDWFFGLRQQDMLLSDPVNNELYYSTAGFQTGLNIYGTIVRGLKFVMSGLYYKPIFATANMGEIVSDHYEAEIGFSKNIFDQFWLTYKFRNEKTVTNITDTSTRLNSEAFRVELIHLELTWEY